MKEGTIFLVRGSTKSFKDKVFLDLVRKFSDSDYVHASIYLGSKYWEMGMKIINFNIINEGFYEYTINGDKFEPIVDLTDEQIKTGLEELKKFNKYSLLKLFFMIYIYPMRWLWKLINYVPFSKNYYSTVCSEAVDKLYKKMGIDLLEGELEDYTSPGDISKSKKLRKVI